MPKHDIDSKVKSGKHKKRQKAFAEFAVDIEQDIILYNKLSDEHKTKWLSADPLFSAFIKLAAKVKR